MPGRNKGPGRRSIAGLALFVSRSLALSVALSPALAMAAALVPALTKTRAPDHSGLQASSLPGLARAQVGLGVGGAERDGLSAVAPAPAPQGSTADGNSEADWHEQQQEGLLATSAQLLGRFEPRSEGLVMPLAGQLSSRFGWRNVSVAGNRYHGGIDLAVDEGTEVAAAADGVVTEAGWAGAYGYSVLVDHGNEIETRYAHLSALWVSVGETVRQGDSLGLSGNTGASTGPHLHFEVRVAGSAVDPLNHVR